MNVPPQVPELDLPALFRSADGKAALSQRTFYIWKGLELGALAGAACAALIPGDILGKSGPIAALLLFIAALTMQVTRVASTAEKTWYDARAAAESIRSAAWQYAVGGEAFRLDDPDAERAFRHVLRDVLATVPHLDIGANANDAPGVTESMRTIRALPQADRSRIYYDQRVAGQVTWYANKARWNKRRSFMYGVIVITLEAVALLAGVARVASGGDVDFLGAVAAIAAAFVAWTQAKKYASLSESYGVTSHEVNLVRDTLPQSADEATWAQSAHDAEAAFSREHTMWRARRQGAV
ncbi:DUF4231 domain-containing protein [Cellulosimicrobium cellulans]|uniref:DUF4231 domain-containing protein n=1 Tax=Cellulosimicrobium cellulans TaxID=1710 RepID=UPI001EF86C95|nr:DUF4231 domain-containing protein [Cellulosimicrobium cellulans]